MLDGLTFPEACTALQRLYERCALSAAGGFVPALEAVARFRAGDSQRAFHCAYAAVQVDRAWQELIAAINDWDCD